MVPWEDGAERIDGGWRAIRRGWYLGNAGFRVRLPEIVKTVMNGKQRETYMGDEVRTHDEAEAERLFRGGLRVLQLEDRDLEEMDKGAPEKQVLAWRLRKRTLVSCDWISRKLKMGDVSRVTQAIIAVNIDKGVRLGNLKKSLGSIS